MSLNPPKKSDRNKAWMQPRRDKAKKLQPEYHLIVTEGTDTEPAYFGAIRDRINARYQGRIQLEIYGEGDNTLNLLNKARNLAFANPNGYRHVWVVYDTDDFPSGHIDQTAQLCETWSTEDTTYHAIWSNQCIELWFLLHFSYMHSDLHRSEYTVLFQAGFHGENGVCPVTGLGIQFSCPAEIFQHCAEYPIPNEIFLRRRNRDGSSIYVSGCHS